MRGLWANWARSMREKMMVSSSLMSTERILSSDNGSSPIMKLSDGILEDESVVWYGKKMVAVWKWGIYITPIKAGLPFQVSYSLLGPYAARSDACHLTAHADTLQMHLSLDSAGSLRVRGSGKPRATEAASGRDTLGHFSTLDHSHRCRSSEHIFSN